MGPPRQCFRFAILSAALAACGLALYSLPCPPGVVPRVAWVCSLLSLAWSIAFFVTPRRVVVSRPSGNEHPMAGWTLRHLALYWGVIAAIIQIVLLTMRCVYVGIDLMHGYPWQGLRDYGFGPTGLWAVLALSASCSLGLLATRDGRLLTVQFWIMVVFAMWACLLCDPFQATKTGGFERTDATLTLVECLACLILVAVVCTGWLTEAKFLQPRANVSCNLADMRSFAGGCPPGFRPSVAALALALNVAIMFHVLVPAGQSTSILRVSGVRAGIAAMVAAVGCLHLLRRSWSAHLADATLGLFALGLCGLATVAVPAGRIPLDQRYPMIFNSIIVGYAFAAGVFAHLVWTWGLAKHEPGSTRTCLVPHLKRFAFFSGATALLSGVMMSFWPGIPGISSMDHSLGRVIAGFAAFLFLLLVTLRSSRLMERLSFHFLTVAVAASMVAFLVTRALPFTSGLPR